MPSATSPPNRSYHHGDLRNAMVAAAVAAARQHGPDAVVVRDIARQVGVSHNAGYRHFASRDELLAAVAEAGLQELADRCLAGLAAVAKKRDPKALARARLRAVGRAYVGFATSEPGLFRATWIGTDAIPDPGQVPPEPDSSEAYRLLGRILDELVEAGAVPASHRPYSEVVAWSAVHGLSTLIIDGPLAGLPQSEIDRIVERLCDVIDAGL